MMAAFHPAWLIARRELRDQMRDWRILTPLILLTVGFPFLMNSFAYSAVELTNQYGGDLIVDRLVPFSILIIGFFPITISLLGALESFVGEKERGTIEPLLGSPLADWQLYLGKLFAGIAGPLASSFTSIAIYLAIVSRQQLNMPGPEIFAQLFLLTIAHALLMVSAAIVISIQSTSVRAANLLASFIIVPVTMLMMGETALFIRLNNRVLWMAVLAVIIMAGLLVRLGLAHFQREYLLGREIDMLNIRWVWLTFWSYFKGGADSVWTWYRDSVRAALWKIRKPAALLAFFMAAGIAVAYFWTLKNLPNYLASSDPQEIAEFQDRIFNAGGINDDNLSAPYLFFHNVQATLAIGFFGLFSFGVLAVILYLINTSVIGGLFGFFKLQGYEILPLFINGILPHGIFEIPALLLSCAAVLHAGLILVTPQEQRTIGDVLLEALADWARIYIGAVTPLLAIAAVIESYITPWLLANAMK